MSRGKVLPSSGFEAAAHHMVDASTRHELIPKLSGPLTMGAWEELLYAPQQANYRANPGSLEAEHCRSVGPFPMPITLAVDGLTHNYYQPPTCKPSSFNSTDPKKGFSGVSSFSCPETTSSE